MVKLQEKSQDELTAWLPGMFEHYVAERVKAGEERASAEKLSDRQRAELFPDGAPVPDQFIMNIIGDDATVGTLWRGRPLGGTRDTWFVFNIEIHRECRGEGLGRAAMEAAESWTRERHGKRLGLA